jgi:hypothetical protein
MHRASVRRTAAIVIILMLAATVGIAALVGGWSFEMPDGARDEPTSTTIVTSPEPAPVQLPPFFGEDVEIPPTSSASPESTTPGAVPDEADRPAS